MRIKVLRLYMYFAGNPVKNTSEDDDDVDDDEDDDDDSHSHMFYRRRYEPATGPYSARTQKRFFESIGSLEKLEMLTLDTIEEFLKMDLESSGLKKWEKLKKLKVLNLIEMAHEIPELEVVRWMIDWETWPKLKILAVPYSQYVRGWMKTQQPRLKTLMNED